MNLLFYLLISAFFEMAAPIKVSSPVFDSKGFIPEKYACQGENINPPIAIKNFPASTKSLVVIVVDNDGPDGFFDHWVYWNVPPTELITENSIQGVEGKNSFGASGYIGPCRTENTHHYSFKVYALDVMLNLRPGSLRVVLENAMRHHILGKGEMIALYKNQGGHAID
jgi:Raf kinase inhibitor-like YbhB/YbcL family protein